jgi:SAM-dependent methyltransferase
MTGQNQLIDRNALLRNRARRMTQQGTFLHDLAIADVQDRLMMVNKSFKEVAIITGWADPWAAAFPAARVIEDTDVLDLSVQSCDLIINALALHCANDPLGQIIQCARSLRPDGLFIAICFGGQTLQELRSALATAESQIMGGLSPRVLPMADLQDLGALLQRAKLALPVADSAAQKVAYSDLYALMDDLRAMGEANPMTDRSRRFTPPSLFQRAEAIYKAEFANSDEQLIATFEQIFLTGWAPDESQQKPLRPGSAKIRLADALGVAEHNLKD